MGGSRILDWEPIDGWEWSVIDNWPNFHYILGGLGVDSAWPCGPRSGNFLGSKLVSAYAPKILFHRSAWTSVMELWDGVMVME